MVPRDLRADTRSMQGDGTQSHSGDKTASAATLLPRVQQHNGMDSVECRDMYRQGLCLQGDAAMGHVVLEMRFR